MVFKAGIRPKCKNWNKAEMQIGIRPNDFHSWNKAEMQKLVNAEKYSRVSLIKLKMARRLTKVTLVEW